MRLLTLPLALCLLSAPAFGSVPDLDPVSRSERQTIVCRDGRTVIAEFSDDRDGVHLVTLQAPSRALSAADRAAIEAAVQELGALGRIEVACNGSGGQIVVSVGGTLVEQEGRMWQRLLTIVWDANGVRGTGRRARPAVELVPWR
ncbi:hypothetical protein E2493_06280 [Sphingomonas parva]|uniref:Uncharacterized protein n=1 Tax=Sphingomonas parva TaxID=2555898 RepID=A0A4Y8ZWP5_9SPHN|nr:hypothetical protein [Sphingomonas parva]TFI59129.1 hypothetical protein E2493_06280 [Sphingomonas parva]